MVARREWHGHTSGGKQHPLYATWIGMVHRCHSEHSASYALYGARGIKVCNRWRYSFSNFLADMGEKPRGKSLDRINNDGDYEPSNCRWATQLEQMQNTRRTKLLEYGGERLSIRAWARKIGITPQAMQDRLRSWPLERALSAPATPAGATGKQNGWKPGRRPVGGQNERILSFSGRAQNITQWAREFGITQSAMSHRISAHGIEKAMQMGVRK